MQVLLSQVQRKPQLAALTWLSKLGRSYLPEFTEMKGKEVGHHSLFTE